MPRVTRKEKEAGKAPRPKARSSVQKPSYGGFKTGPARAGKDAYMGKAKKMKDDLIERAKVKKQFAKVLKKEGMDSERLGDGTRRRQEREPREAGSEKKEWKDKGKPREGKPREGKPREGQSQERRGPRGGREDEDMARILARAGPSKPSPSSKPFKSSKPYPNSKPYTKRPRDSSPSSSFSAPAPAAPAKPRALSPERLALPEPPKVDGKEASLRTLKKEGFSKFHWSRDAPAAGAGAPRGKGMRGQPNMGSRMDVLLEKIRRDTTKKA
ncbi:hypothetical protein L198_06718 [Cryptococcus wingfieldii CBS 7118]|uniref:rRNA-processing protein FYV7 n=1 Tax=Cryptococcus wingfieldii CBS 7118 TaxID=1295528 RepID=A0A1E3IKG8_9TREE|nr:hypothetical protein L198_06718 [Cryptococcus wingfieldii CBS 7118]ODN88446.1 hypothetical protein L198_06718 [Cryptococcus wingfieldii CBS 7118]